MNRTQKNFVFLLPLIIAAGLTVLSQEMEHAAMVAPINKEISADDVAVEVENIFLYPNEESLYGPGKENYGMPVQEEYGKGPVVVLDIKKKPDWIDKLSGMGINPWIDVQLYSDGKPLGKGSGSSTGIYGFNFWVAGPDNVTSVELNELGDVECRIRLSTVEKVCDIPSNDISRGEQPFFEDENVRIWDVMWEEKAGYNNEPETTVRIGIETKTKFMTLDVVLKENGGLDIKPTSASFIPASESLERANIYFSRYITKNSLSGAELWKIVPVVEETFPVRFIPQKYAFSQDEMVIRPMPIKIFF